MAEEQKRAAERIDLKEPIQATIGDMEARIVELSLIGGRIEHTGRLSMNATVTLQFRWRGENIRLKAKIARTEMRSIGGRPGYSSGVNFASSPEEAPAPLRKIIASLVELPPVGQIEELPPLPDIEAPAAAIELPPPNPAQPIPFFADEEDVEEIEAAAEIPTTPYVRCSWEEERWVTEFVSDPRQPRNGFTMLAPDDESEIEDFCRTYAVADPETQRMIRLSFELAIAQRGK